MKEKKQVLKGEEGFNSYYSELFGERWNSLKESFFKENQSVEYKVRNAEKSYFLDSASIFAALNLPVKGAKNILDLCAAPGGKTLVLASRMDEDAQLSSNERSSDRKHRLSVVVETCLPEEISERVRVSCSDGSTWCTRQSECFGRILLDAPCSSERHVIQDPKYLNTWSPSRIKTVAMEQWALFSSAYRLLEPDGIMVYSTCALNPVENDEMIEKLIKKFNKDGKSFELLESKIDMNEVTDYANFRIPVIEKTKYGYQILPDTAEGAGPIYFSIVHKIQSIQS
ncbi:MAG: RsmB/NOP family class I SAM-dependent RNA methyltransferase [Treponema sp.]|nr:RsmB/NOP family class I SAM-dependent RNA methyltransferase [Spirochaetia bacterium]MDY2840369.1 RsmB/NOP family class I SAM-dependent RNA methyltransferase [Treponema sp.]